jgi:hypothetical protein
MVAESEGVEVGSGEEGRTDEVANGRRFDGSVVGAVRDVVEGRDEFGRAVKRGMLNEQIGEEVETTGFEVGSSLDRRSRRHEKFNGIRGAAEDKAGKTHRR